MSIWKPTGFGPAHWAMPGDLAMYASSMGQLDIQLSTTPCIRVSLRSHFLGMAWLAWSAESVVKKGLQLQTSSWRAKERSQQGGSNTAAVLSRSNQNWRPKMPTAPFEPRFSQAAL